MEICALGEDKLWKSEVSGKLDLGKSWFGGHIQEKKYLVPHKIKYSSLNESVLGTGRKK